MTRWDADKTPAEDMESTFTCSVKNPRKDQREIHENIKSS